MNKLKLTTLLLGGSLSANAQFMDTSSNDYVTYPAQDTICTMITKENRFEFNYYTSEIIKEREEGKEALEDLKNLGVNISKDVESAYTKKRAVPGAPVGVSIQQVLDQALARFGL